MVDSAPSYSHTVGDGHQKLTVAEVISEPVDLHVVVDDHLLLAARGVHVVPEPVGLQPT